MGRSRRREAMLEAAIALFSQKGYHATTVREIAQAVGILPGSLYAHMAAKEDLLCEAVEQALGALPGGRSAHRGVARPRRRAAAAGHGRAHPRGGRVPRRGYRLPARVARAASERRAQAVAYRRKYEELLSRIIHDGIESGVFRPVDERFVRLLVLSVVNWTYQWYRADGPLSPEQVADQFYAIISQGLLNGETSGGRFSGERSAVSRGLSGERSVVSRETCA